MTYPQRNVKISVTYDGSSYFGFQYQPDRPTIQGELEKALCLIVGESYRVHGSGRTDTGVHAVNQVVSFRTHCPIPVEKLESALNGVLPPSIRVYDLEEVCRSFHARFSARGKRYRYLIRHGVSPSPFRERYCCQIPERLDVEAVRETAAVFIGEHDFSAFTRSPHRKTDCVRTVTGSVVRAIGNLIVFDVEGSGFLYNMVRNLAKALIMTGGHHLKSEQIVELYRNQDRRLLGNPAPAGGLYLMKVMY